MKSQFGKTDLMVTPIVYGCMGGAGAFGKQDEKDSIAALQTAFDIGINFFDTAEAYGNGYSEQLLGRALGHKRNDIVISSKVNFPHLAPGDLVEACERSLKNLNTDYIDLYLIHWPNRNVPLADTIGALTNLQNQGKIRYYGVSNFGKDDLDDVLKLGDISANQIAYNLLYRAVEFDVQPRCEKEGIPMMTYSSLMQGLLAGKYKSLNDFPENRARTRMFDSRKWPQTRHGEFGAEDEGQKALDAIMKVVSETGFTMEELAVGWLKAQKSVGGVLVGTRNQEQSRALAKLLELNLDSEIVNVLSRATEDLKQALGRNIDMWDVTRTR